MTRFWTLFILDAWMTSGVFVHALTGVADGDADTETTLWYLLVIGVIVGVLGGSQWLKSRGRMKAAQALLLTIALLPVLAGLAFIILLTSATNFR